MLILYLVFVIVLILWGLKFKNNNDYISKERCNSIKGVFILLILLTHSMQYIDSSGYMYGGADRLVQMFRNGIGQLVVVMFLFYSGYGVALSIERKGKTYVDNMPRHRLLPTLLNFDVAVLVFVILNLILDKQMSISQIGLSLLGWDSVGNSNWYIFDILLCYATNYIVAKFFSGRYLWIWLLASVVVVIFVLSLFKSAYWYNTLLAYPAGAVFAQYEKRIIGLFQKYYVVLLILLSGLFVVCFFILPSAKGIFTNIASVCFAFIVIMLSMKVVVGNAFLNWCGTNLFPLYIYQRIPMIVMYDLIGTGFVSSYPELFVFLALLITAIIAYFYKYWRISKI